MVAHVVALQIFERPPAHAKMVRGVMDQVVGQVTEHEARHQRVDPLRRFQDQAGCQVEQAVKYDRHGYTDRRRHHQARFTLRLGVVDAVEQEDQPFHAIAAGVEMEHVAVQGVFGESPQN